MPFRTKRTAATLRPASAGICRLPARPGRKPRRLISSKRLLLLIAQAAELEERRRASRRRPASGRSGRLGNRPLESAAAPPVRRPPPDPARPRRLIEQSAPRTLAGQDKRRLGGAQMAESRKSWPCCSRPARDQRGHGVTIEVAQLKYRSPAPVPAARDAVAAHQVVAGGEEEMGRARRRPAVAARSSRRTTPNPPSRRRSRRSALCTMVLAQRAAVADLAVDAAGLCGELASLPKRRSKMPARPSARGASQRGAGSRVPLVAQLAGGDRPHRPRGGGRRGAGRCRIPRQLRARRSASRAPRRASAAGHLSAARRAR